MAISHVNFVDIAPSPPVTPCCDGGATLPLTLQADAPASPLSPGQRLVPEHVRHATNFEPSIEPAEVTAGASPPATPDDPSPARTVTLTRLNPGALIATRPKELSAGAVAFGDTKENPSTRVDLLIVIARTPVRLVDVTNALLAETFHAPPLQAKKPNIETPSRIVTCST